MKIRTGFVSNSSSSSFMIFGVCFSLDDFNLSSPVFLYSYIRERMECDEKLRELLGSYLVYDLIYHGLDDYDGEDFIGLSLDTIKDDETFMDFKKRVYRILKHLGYNKDFESLQIWRDSGRD